MIWISRSRNVLNFIRTSRTEFGCLMLHSFGLRLVGVISV
ncbi:hypothetical protein LEP1GSC102_1319 [Leptospira interrogans str. UI 09600]|nr:hypothetical protein LEP1GSC102_1319 [Leptospira interrogans str. UI 09600]